MMDTKLSSIVLALTLTSSAVLASPVTSVINPVSGTATSKSQGFTESYVSIGATATATQTATATTSGLATATGMVTDVMAEVKTTATQTSSVTATGTFEGMVGPSTIPSFSNAGAFSFSSAEAIAAIPAVIAPGNNGNNGNNGNGNNNNGGS